MNRQIIAGLILAGTLIAAPTAKALPMVDIGVGGGPLTIEDDDSSAIALSGTVGVNIPVIPLVGVEGHIIQTVQDGEIGVSDYSGNQLGAFMTITTPTPGIKVKGKVGMMRWDYEFDYPGGSSSLDGSDLAFGIAARFSDWQIELTRTMAEDDFDNEFNIDMLSVSYIF